MTAERLLKPPSSRYRRRRRAPGSDFHIRWLQPAQFSGKPLAGKTQSFNSKDFADTYEWWPFGGQPRAVPTAWPVEDIVDSRRSPEGVVEYLVRFQTTDEPYEEWVKENDMDCADLVRGFEERRVQR